MTCSSFHDFSAQNCESNYHLFMLGLLIAMHDGSSSQLKSNRESGIGKFDVLLETDDKKNVFIFEFKISLSKNCMVTNVQKSMNQIEDKKYDCETSLITDNKVLIAICFYRKECLVNYKLYKRKEFSSDFQLDTSNIFIS